jgi:GNAT superfamily N-acetyltransferase
MITTRIARITDAGDISSLTAQLGYDVEASEVRARLSTILMRPDHLFLVAAEDERRIGWIHATIVEYIEADRFVIVAGLVVDRDHRKAGVGRMLLAAVERWAAQQGCSIVRLWSSATRTGAHRFYETVGYTRIKTQYSFAKSLATSGEGAFKGFIPHVDEEPPS